MNPTFGVRLRTQREKKSVALSDISSKTKIKLSLLEAIERDDLTHWPHGLFGRAYLRAYAQAIGLDPEPLMREFLAMHPDPPDEFEIAERSRPTGLSGAIRSAVNALPGMRRYEKDVEPWDPPNSAVVSSASPVAVPAAPPPEVHRPAPVSEASQLATIASICARLQRAEGSRDLVPILGNVARMLDATGLVLWVWDATTLALTPWLAHGYSNQLVAHLPNVKRDDDNAIAAAYRTAKPCIVDGNGSTGAIVVPLVAGSRCLGALALEMKDGGERRTYVRDVAVILAALLTGFVEVGSYAAAANA